MRRASMLIAAVVIAVVAPVTAQRSDITAFFDQFTAEWMRAHPNLAASSRYFSGDEQRRFERQITPYTQAQEQRSVRLAQRGVAGLRRFDRGKLSTADRLSADIMAWQLDSAVRSARYDDYSFPLEQFGGANVGLVELLTVRHPLATAADADNYIARLHLVGTRMDEAIAEGRRIAGRGLLPPRFIVDVTLRQMGDFIALPARDNPFVTSLAERLPADAVPAGRREQLRADAERIVDGEVYPAWRRGIALLEAIRPRTGDAAGLWRFKDGDRAYAEALRNFTTTELTAEQIHQIGLQEVARIEAEMDRLLRQLGRTEGTVQARIARLTGDLQYPNPTSEASRAAIMHDIDGIIADAQRRAEAMFYLRPKAPIVARPFPKFRETNAQANYNLPAPDGSRPGVFQMPLRVEKMTKFGLRSVVYHETVPGHHFQLALQVENRSLPRFRQLRAFGGLSAFTEGWGLYAERLAAESGWYEGDVEGRLGQLDYELFRARRLVVDTGIHAKHWTRQQAIDYGIEAAEVERYVVYPGQACSYMIGELKIVEMRERARKALGDRFSLRDYHDLVLGLGMVPLAVLEQQVDAYIRDKTGRAAS